MQTLRMTSPINLAQHFEVPVDTTTWSADHRYHKVEKQGHTPLRPKAPFKWYTYLLPKTEEGGKMERSFGLYMIAARQPQKAFYVGIAAEDGRSPEGVLTRIRKHRVKLTGSHIGANPTEGDAWLPKSVGGVNHTRAWREYATVRYNSLSSTGAVQDTCSDVQIATATVPGNAKKVLEHFEAQIFHDVGGIMQRILDVFWPGEDNKDVFLLTSATRKPSQGTLGSIVLPKA